VRGSMHHHRPRNTERHHSSMSMAANPGFVTSFLYFFKPPFPSDGGCAAASAGRSGPSAPHRATMPVESCKGRQTAF
jgi:hypothetical protein